MFSRQQYSRDGTGKATHTSATRTVTQTRSGDMFHVNVKKSCNVRELPPGPVNNPKVTSSMSKVKQDYARSSGGTQRRACGANTHTCRK